MLGALEIAPEQLTAALAGASSAEPGQGPDSALRFSGPAARVLELTVAEVGMLGHNYVGCEHLLLGLVAEPDGAGGEVLRAAGAEPKLTRRAVAAALVGYNYLRAGQGTTPPRPASSPRCSSSSCSSNSSRWSRGSRAWKPGWATQPTDKAVGPSPVDWNNPVNRGGVMGEMFACAGCDCPLTVPLSQVALPVLAHQSYGRERWLPPLMAAGTYAVDSEPWGPPGRPWRELGEGEAVARGCSRRSTSCRKGRGERS